MRSEGTLDVLRVVDRLGRTVDFLLRERRDVTAAKHLFSQAMKKHGIPRVITLDAYGFAPSHHGGGINMKSKTACKSTTSKYLNNVVEQDHRRIKRRIRPMLGFKRFDTAAVTIRGVELGEAFRKHQFKLQTCPAKTTLPPKCGQQLCQPDSIQTLPRSSITSSLEVCTRTDHAMEAGTSLA